MGIFEGVGKVSSLFILFLHGIRAHAELSSDSCRTRIDFLIGIVQRFGIARV